MHGEGVKVDARLPGKGNSNSHGARPVHLIITMTKWIRTSRLSIKNSLSNLKGEGVCTLTLHPTPSTEPSTEPHHPAHLVLRVVLGGGRFLMSEAPM